MIDLSQQSERIQKWMDESIQRFLIEFPEKSPTSIGLYSSPVNGWVSLCIDVASEAGRLATSCPDFTYPEYALIEFSDWQNEYELSSSLIKRHDAVVVRFNEAEGDEVFNRHFFDFLMRVLNDFYHGKKVVFRPTWAGVQILDSRFVSFGRIHHPNNP